MGNGVLLHEGLVSIQIEVRVLQQRLVVDQLTFGLLQLHFVGPRVDLHQQIVFVNNLPFFELDLHELPVHPALHGDGIDGRNRAQTSYEYLDVAFGCSRRHHLRRAAARAAPAAPALGLSRGVTATGEESFELGPLPIPHSGEYRQDDHPYPAPAPRGRRRWGIMLDGFGRGRTGGL